MTGPRGPSSHFYPRPPRGGRPNGFPVDNNAFLFLSTPSARRATGCGGGPGLSGSHFYPRPPRGGRRRIRPQTRQLWYFYPRPPRGGRPADFKTSEECIKFLSTPSARRATLSRRHCRLPPAISIHALREEGDVRPSRSTAPRPTFLSTPSARRATMRTSRSRPQAVSFLSTPSARRATSRHHRG